MRQGLSIIPHAEPDMAGQLQTKNIDNLQKVMDLFVNIDNMSGNKKHLKKYWRNVYEK